MKPLKKSYEASLQREIVRIDGHEYEIANLKKSGMTHSYYILLAHNDEWHQIDIRKIMGTGVSINLEPIKNYIQDNDITLEKLGVIKNSKKIEVPEIDYPLLHKKFPAYSIDDIKKLHSFYSKYRNCPIQELKAGLAQLAKRYQSVDDYISESLFMEKNDWKPVKREDVENKFWLHEDGSIANPDVDYEYLEGGANVRLFTGQFKDGTWGHGMYVFSGTGKPEIVKVNKQPSSPTKEKAFEFACIKSLYMIKDLIEKGVQNLYKPQSEINKLLNKSDMSEHVKLRENRLKVLGLKYNKAEDEFTGFGFRVTGNDIESKSGEEFDMIIDQIQEALETPIEHDLIDAVIDVRDNDPETEEPAKNNGFQKIEVAEPLTPEALKGLNNQQLIDKAGDIVRGIETTEILQGAVQAKKPVSLETIGSLAPERILELQGLMDKQLKIVKENPVIKPTDKKTHEAAKKNAQVLLKASTALDGTSGTLAMAKKYLSTLGKTLESVITPAAQVTRKPYDEQQQLIKEYENAEALRIEKEQRERALKIKQRTDSLFEAGMAQNATHYFIGTFFILASQIEKSTDEEFSALLLQAQTVKAELDAAAQIESEKDRKIKELEAQLAALNGTPSTVAEAAKMIDAVMPPETETYIAPPAPVVRNVPAPPVPNASTSVKPMRYPYATEFIPATNPLLEQLDREHLEIMNDAEKMPMYVRRRSYFDRGCKDTADAITSIMNDPALPTKKQAIIDFCNMIKNG